MSESDQRFTPEWLLELVRDFAGGPIALDTCTIRDNPTQALRAFARTSTLGGADGWEPGAGGLAEPWTLAGHGLAWCNPPYSRGMVKLWADRAIEMARDFLVESIVLTRADVRTQWFTTLRTNMDAVCFANRSIGFVHPDKGQLPGDTVGHALWYFGPQRARFRRVFEPLGWVLDGPGPQEHSEPLRQALGIDREVGDAAE